MKKLVSLLLVVMLCVTSVSALAFAPGTYEASEQGFGGPVTVTVTVDGDKVTEIAIKGDSETPGLGAAAIEQFAASLVGVSDAEGVEAIAGSTVTSEAVKAALAKALAQANGEAADEAPLAFTAGTYEAAAAGYNGPVSVIVTFSESAVTDILVTAQSETAHVGDIAFDIMIADMLAANGSGVDAVAGATFSSAALRNAVNAAAEQAACTNLDAFKAATVVHEAKAPIEDTWDVVIVGAGGAGMIAAAQTAQDGNTVLIIEKNAEMGGNTLVSGGAFQAAMDYLVWDPANPDATTGVNPIDGQTHGNQL